MKVQFAYKEILILSFFFTALAIYYNIHDENYVLTFIINHTVALLIALILSKGIYYFISTHKYT
jgi:K+-sensing histidine kinase KdpD